MKKEKVVINLYGGNQAKQLGFIVKSFKGLFDIKSQMAKDVKYKCIDNGKGLLVLSAFKDLSEKDLSHVKYFLTKGRFVFFFEGGKHVKGKIFKTVEEFSNFKETKVSERLDYFKLLRNFNLLFTDEVSAKKLLNIILEDYNKE